MRKHDNEEPQVCDDCGFISNNDHTFYNHMKYHHDKVVHICEFCTNEFKKYVITCDYVLLKQINCIFPSVCVIERKNEKL